MVSPDNHRQTHARCGACARANPCGIGRPRHHGVPDPCGGAQHRHGPGGAQLNARMRCSLVVGGMGRGGQAGKGAWGGDARLAREHGEGRQGCGYGEAMPGWQGSMGRRVLKLRTLLYKAGTSVLEALFDKKSLVFDLREDMRRTTQWGEYVSELVLGCVVVVGGELLRARWGLVELVGMLLLLTTDDCCCCYGDVAATGTHCSSCS